MLYFQSFEEVMLTLKRRRVIILTLFFLGCIASLVLALSTTPTYNAIAVVQIEDAQVAGTNTSAGAMVDNRASLDTRRTVQLIEQRVMSRGSLVDIMDEYDLFTDIPGLTQAMRVDRMRRAVTVQAIGGGEAWQPVQPVSGLFISTSLDDPQKAADVANEMLARVMEEARSRSVERAQLELDFFVVEEARIRDEIATAETEIADFKSANAEMLPSNILVLQAELATLNGNLLTLRQELLTRQSNSARTRPEALVREMALVQDQISLIEARIAEINALIAQAPEVERDLTGLERGLTQLNEQFTVISRRKADAEMGQLLSEQRQLARFEVLERAVVPDVPVSRGKRSVVMLGGMVSLALALGVAVVLELLNPVIRTAAQMERALGVRPVISVPLLDHKSVSPPKNRRKRWIAALAVLGAGALVLLSRLAKPIASG